MAILRTDVPSSQYRRTPQSAGTYWHPPLHNETASVTKDNVFYIRKGRVMQPRGGNGMGLLRQMLGGYMSLLRDIQDGATEDSVSLGSLLRKTKLLAGRIGVKEISEWAERELSRYDDSEELPPYRGPFEATVLGNAAGTYGRELRNFPIPSMALSEEYRDGHLTQALLHHFGL